MTVSCESDRKPGLHSDACNRYQYLEPPCRTRDTGVIKEVKEYIVLIFDTGSLISLARVTLKIDDTDQKHSVMPGVQCVVGKCGVSRGIHLLWVNVFHRRCGTVSFTEPLSIQQMQQNASLVCSPFPLVIGDQNERPVSLLLGTQTVSLT